MLGPTTRRQAATFRTRSFIRKRAALAHTLTPLLLQWGIAILMVLMFWIIRQARAFTCRTCANILLSKTPAAMATHPKTAPATGWTRRATKHQRAPSFGSICGLAVLAQPSR